MRPCPFRLALALLLLLSFAFAFPTSTFARKLSSDQQQWSASSSFPTRDSRIILPSDIRTGPARGDLPHFREAPAFRNGKECIIGPTTDPHPFSPPTGDDNTTLCDPFSVHIAMTLDAGYLRGSVAAILSVVQHAACPENIAFHFLASRRQRELSERIRTTFPYLRFNVYHFDEDLVKGRISASIRHALDHPLNYARTYTADILPTCVRRVIYLDSDIILVDDIAKLWGISLGAHTLGAPEYCHANFTKYFTDDFWSNPALSGVFRSRKPCYFNTGVMVMDLERWRERGFSRAIETWMELQKERRIYELGSLPPFLLAFAGDVEPVDHRWNQHGLGGDNLEGRCRSLHPGPVSLLHWSGKGKPWVRLDARRSCPLDTLWAPYDLFMGSLYS